MKITIESTDMVTTLDGVGARVWEGITEDGARCKVFVHRVAVAGTEDTARFDRELEEKLPPAAYVPIYLIL